MHVVAISGQSDPSKPRYRKKNHLTNFDSNPEEKHDKSLETLRIEFQIVRGCTARRMSIG